MICQCRERMMRVMLAGMLAAMSVCAGTAHEPAVVHVRVFEHDGDAASGVPVWISMSGQRMKAGEGDLCAVARRGLAVISNVPTDAGHVYVGLDLPVGAQRQERVAVRPGGRATTALVLPVHGSIRVVAEEGPAAGVDARRRHVELTRMEDGAVGAVQLQYVHGMITTALYERVPAGRYIVDVQINGISVARTNVAVQGRKTVEVDGTARGALSAVRGRVEDADGRGVRGRLEVRGSGERHAKIYDEFVGQYHVEPLVAGREYRLTFVVGTTSVVKKVVAGAVEEVNVRLPRSYRVTGRLQYADGSVCSNGLTLGSVAAAYSNGVAVFELVFPGVYTLRHEVLNRIMSYLIVTVEGSNVDVGEVTIADRVVIRGRIVGEKLPEQLCVEMRKKKMKTFNVAAYMALDEAGQFELRGVARDNIIRIREPGRRTQEPVAQAGPFEEDAYDLGEVRIKGRVPMRTIRAIVVVAGMGLGVLTIIPFVLYALGVRKWAVRGAAWGIWDGVAAGLFFLFESVCVGMVAVGMTNEMEMGADTGALMWGLLAVNVLTCGYIVTLAWARRTRVGILLPCGRVPWRQAAAWIFFGVAGTQAVSISYVWALRAFNIQMPMQDVLGILLRVASAGETVVVIVTGMVLIPVCEEIMFRGVIFSALRRRMTLWAAVTLSAIIFAVVHLQVIYLLPIGLMGAVSALSYVRTKSLVVPIGMHVLNNLVALGYLFWRLWTLG